MPLTWDPNDVHGDIIEIPSDDDEPDVDANTKQLVTQLQSQAIVSLKRKKEAETKPKDLTLREDFSDAQLIAADYETGNYKDIAARLWKHREQLKTIGSAVATYVKKNGWRDAAATSAFVAGTAVGGPILGGIAAGTVELGNALYSIFNKGPGRGSWKEGDWCAIDTDNEALRKKGEGMDVQVGFFLDEGIKVNHVKVYNMILARPQEVLEKFIHPITDVQKEMLSTNFGGLRDAFIAALGAPLAIKGSGINVDPGTQLLVKGKGADQLPVTVMNVTEEGVFVDDGGMVKVYQLSDLTNGDVPHNVNHPYTAVSGYIPGDKVGRHVGQYIWCKARAEIAGAPWFAPEELSIIRQIYSDDIQIVYCLDGVTGTKTMVASWGRLSDDEEHTVETRDFQLFTNAVVERSGEFWKYIPGVISRDNALFCVGKASDEAYHAQLREHFQKPENLGIEPEKVGVAPNEDEAERKDFEEELQQTGRRRGDVIWAKDIEPVTELRVVSADTQSVYLLVGIAAVAAFLITTT